MKTLVGTLLALGLLSTAASAQYCPPGYGFRTTYQQSVPAPKVAEAPIEAAPAAPIEPAPLPAQPAPEAVPPK